MSYIISIYIIYSFLLFIINTEYIKIPFKIQDYTYGNEDAIILKYIKLNKKNKKIYLFI